MGERTKYTPGTFSWTDLATTDQGAAKEFYAGLLGWTYDDMPMDDQGGLYSMAKMKDRYVAAIAPMQPGMEGHPPFWASYVTVDDADAAAAKAKELGANVMGEPFDVFESGRMAIIQDPQGAVFSVWQPKQHIGAGLVNEPGALCWNGLLVPDPEAAKQFYRDLFGWSTEPFGERYWNWQNGGKTNGGVGPLPPGGEVPPNWGVAFGIDDIDAGAARVGELGGQVLVEPSAMGGIGSYSVLTDPQGAVFTLYAGQFDP
jgi:uncharacterized protein